MVDSFSDLKVLVLGDIIFDEYNCSNPGLNLKESILSGRSLYKSTGGGALAVFRHALVSKIQNF